MRRAFLAFILSAPFISGCAIAAPVTLTWQYPRFNAASLGSCTASSDTLKDLGRAQLWGQLAGRTDSSLVMDRTVVGKENQPDSLVTQQAEGTVTYWLYLFDINGNRSCRSNPASRTVAQPPLPANMQ